MVCLTLDKKPTLHNLIKLREGVSPPRKKRIKMTLTQTIEIENDIYIVEYVMSIVSNTIKIVEMTKNGKFHRMNWIKDVDTRLMIRQTLEESYDQTLP